jgi:hypothetical protein
MSIVFVFFTRIAKTNNNFHTYDYKLLYLLLFWVKLNMKERFGD